MKNLVLMLAVAAVLSGCSYSIKDIDVSNLEPGCVRQCAADYSTCVTAGNQVNFKTDALWACREAYIVCTNTCPPR